MKPQSIVGYDEKVSWFSGSKTYELNCDKILKVIITNKEGYEGIKKNELIKKENVISSSYYIDKSFITINKSCFIVLYNESENDIVKYNLTYYERNYRNGSTITGFGF